MRMAEQTDRLRIMDMDREVRMNAGVLNVHFPKGMVPNQKTLRHIANRGADVKSHKDALRHALRYVVAAAVVDMGAAAVIESIRAIEPGFLSDAFLHRHDEEKEAG